MVACQDDRDGAPWDPARIHVELEIAKHPLAGTDALVGMDRGHGFTEGDVARFLTIGPDDTDEAFVGRHGGASRNQLGRFAYLALRRDRDPDKGFTILTRTSTDGPVTWIRVTPRALAQQQDLPNGKFPADATELGRYRNYRGRFSAVVIPNPQIRTNDELERELAPYLPRKPELCGTILIGGNRFVPPPLASGAIVKPEGVALEAYLERAEHGMRSGVYLVDLTTGFRVGFCPALVAHLPYPLGRPDLAGDIFLPGLLGQQETTRSGLRAKFLRSKTWERFADLLRVHVTGAATALLDDAGAVGSSEIGRLLSTDIRDLFRKTYGDPDLSDPPPDGITPPPSPPGPPRGPRGKYGPQSPGPRVRKPHYFALKIGGETWWIGVTRDDANLFAVAKDGERKIAMVNTAYDITPKARPAAAEHALLGLLWAIAREKHPFETTDAQRFVAERRRELRKAEEKK